MARDVDFPRLRQQAGNLRQRDLIRIAQQLGWMLDQRRGKGSHLSVRKAGQSITIPYQPKPGTVRGILKMLEREARR